MHGEYSRLLRNSNDEIKQAFRKRLLRELSQMR